MLKRQIENTKLSQIEAAVASKKQKTDPSSQSQGTMSPPKQWTSRRSSVADAADAPQFAHRVRTEKVMNDNIHGRITLPGVAVAFIDTPQFQRLRKFKTLFPVDPFVGASCRPPPDPATLVAVSEPYQRLKCAGGNGRYCSIPSTK